VERDPQLPAITDTDRLAWISHAWGGQRVDYASHVVARGGTGDLSDIRSFIDAAMAAASDPGSLFGPSDGDIQAKAKEMYQTQAGSLIAYPDPWDRLPRATRQGWRAKARATLMQEKAHHV
jgi:hypothetical protein